MMTRDMATHPNSTEAGKDPGLERSWSDAVWEAASDAMSLSDSEGNVVAANPAYYRLYGYGPDDVIGRSFAIIFPASSRDQAENEYRKTFQEAVAGTVEDVPVRRMDGTELRVDVGYSFVTEPERMMLSVIRDVSEKVWQLEAEREASRQKDAMLTAVVHDLRTPLTSIRGQTQFLLRQTQRLEEVRQDVVMNGLRQIEKATTRMVRLTDEMVDASRLSQGHPFELQLSQVNLLEIARSVAADLSLTSDLHEILVNGEDNVIGHWDGPRLERAVENLVSNAIKYNPNGGPITITVSRGYGDQTGLALLTVTDEGVGIPQTDQKRIFDPFYRADSVRQGIAGSGIGLAGVRQILNYHGGTIEVKSQLNQGATFIVRLPINEQPQ